MADYTIAKHAPPLEDFIRLREITGLSAYSPEAAKKGLEGTIFGVSILAGDDYVAMGRLVGDGGCVFVIADIAVDPAHQGKGLGKAVMTTIMDYVNSELESRAYISLVADLPADKLYAQFGFEDTRPASIGMAYRVE